MRNATFFATAQRGDDDTLRRHISYFSDAAFVRSLLNALPTTLLILNAFRQIVFANRAFYELVGMTASGEVILGRRPGEALSCSQLTHAPSGCGTGQPCAHCGAVLSILEGLDGRKNVQECRLSRTQEEQGVEDLDLLVWSTPFHHADEAFTICAFTDVSSEKRRDALESIFLHDILNVAGGLKGFAELLTTHAVDDKDELLGLISVGANKIVDEIRAQQLLLAAERGELRLQIEPIPLECFLRELVGLYLSHDAAQGKQLSLDAIDPELGLQTDPTLLGRVVGNMLKNALEASLAGQRVTVGAKADDESVEIWVHNATPIPLGVQFQLFHRSFSTKGASRGLGTYSMRLLSQYIGGQVSFSSTPEAGTIFRARYPRQAVQPVSA